MSQDNYKNDVFFYRMLDFLINLNPEILSSLEQEELEDILFEWNWVIRE